MASEQMRDVIELLSMQPLFQVTDVNEMRAQMERMVGGGTLPAGATVDTVTIGANPADWIAMPNSAANRVVLYLHGGGYLLGSRRTHRELATRIAREAASRVLLLEYRLAPEHPFPAALDDATAAYRWLRAQNVPARSIAIAGDRRAGV